MQQPRVQLRLKFADGTTFGPGKAELLTLIQAHGSIAAAGREMRMSYKRAWGLVEEMNRSFAEPLVTTERGGAARGGAQVTAAGEAIVQRYRSLEAGIAVQGAADLQAIAQALTLHDDGLSAPGDPNMFDET
jgi:molybdate transport system regulatory protein